MSPRWSPARVPAFWLLLVVNCLVGVAVLAISAMLFYYAPRASAVSVPLVLAYAVAWLLLVLRVLDKAERRPVWLVGAAVGWGATAACAVGVSAGAYLDNVLAKGVSPSFAAEWGACLVAPTAEEAAKAAGVVLILLAARPHLTTVWSGAVYGALIGIGFTVTEDAGYALTYADQALPDDVTAAVQVLVLRFSTPGLVGHPLFAAVAGAGVAYAWLRTDRSTGRRLAVAGGGLAAAWLTHAVVNSPLASGTAAALLGLGWAAGWAGYVLVTLVPGLPVLYWLLSLRPRPRP